MNASDVQPVAEPLTNDGREPAVLPWAEARKRLSDARYYWLGTVHPSGLAQCGRCSPCGWAARSTRRQARRLARGGTSTVMAVALSR